MKILRWRRRSGKTTRLVDMLLDDHNAILVVPDNQQKKFVEELLLDRMRDRDEYAHSHYDYLRTRILTLHEGPKEKTAGVVVSKILVDNLDFVLGYVFGRIPHTVTMTVDEDEEPGMRPEHLSGGSRL